jgi:hypothetical protein
LQAKIVGLLVSRKNSRISLRSSSVSSAVSAGLPALRCGNNFSQRASSAFAVLSPERAPFCTRSRRFLRAGEVGEDELRIDHLDIAHRIDRSTDVMNIGVLKAAHDLHDGVHLADVAEELITQSFTRARSSDETGDIDELDGCRDQLLGVRDLREDIQSRVGNDDHADIRIDGAEGVIRCLRLPGARDSIEESGFSNVGKADDSG